ncbi:MAG: glycosyltransferase family 39 protein [Anaerolineae bacterium]|nr:glycosyltransferase family 39 protein [Anaerolineae bacterium]
MTARQPADALNRAYSVLRWVFLLAVLVYLTLFGLNSLTRLRRFSPDSMNYVDVARNIAAGRGIVQSTLGFNQPHWDAGRTIPTPITSQPPVYALLIVLLSALGLSWADAALLVPVLSYGAVLLLTWLLVRELFDPGVALIATACLLLYAPLRFVSSYAWSEAPAVALAWLALWLLARTRRTLRQRYLWPLLAGLATGLAFATRYAFLPLFVLGILLLIEPESRQWTARNLALYAAGFVLPALWVVGRSLYFDGALLGPARNSSLRGLGENWGDMIDALFKSYLDGVERERQGLWFWLSMIGMGLILAARRQLGKTLEEVFLGGKAYLLTLWALSYLGLLLYQRTQTHFDQIGPRLVVPAGVALVLLWTVLLVKTVKLEAKYLIYGALLLGALAIRDQVKLWQELEPQSEADAIARSERLSWVAQHTTARDLVVGDDTMDLPFYFGYEAAISFSPYPYTDHPDYDTLMAYLDQHCAEYSNIFLVLRRRCDNETCWRYMYGPFIADLVAGRTEAYAGVTVQRRLSDGYVFRLSPCD